MKQPTYKTAQEYKAAGEKRVKEFFAKHPEFTSYSGGEKIVGNFKLVVEMDSNPDFHYLNDGDAEFSGIGLDLSGMTNHNSYGEPCPVDLSNYVHWQKNPANGNFNKEENFALLQFQQNYHKVPIYMYQHSGTTVNTTGFSCPWDSGMVGYAFISKTDFIKGGFYGVKKSWPAAKREDFANMMLTGWVQDLDDMFTGNCFQFIVTDLRSDEEVDATYGFWGCASGAIEQGLQSIAYLVKEENTKRNNKLRDLIKNRVPLSVREMLLSNIRITM